MSVETSFAEGDPVECKAGIGTVTYCEDGFMEVALKDRTERNFKAPFEGKVWHYVKPVRVADLPVWTTIMQHPKVLERSSALEDFHGITSAVAMVIGGEVSSWSQLSDYQRLNFLAVLTGCPAPFWRDAAESGNLDELVETWLK
jgi:hypothetical protein